MQMGLVLLMSYIEQWFTVRCGQVYCIWLTFVHVAMAVTLCILLGQ